MTILSVHQLPGQNIVRSKDERTGFRQISITFNYRLETDSATAPVVDHANFPSIGDEIDYDGFTLSCKANPITGQDPAYRKWFYASATFDNIGDEGSRDITEQIVLKTWRPVQFREVVSDAEFLGVFDEDLEIVDGLAPDGMAVGDRTPIINSAKIPRPKERTFHGRKFRIPQYFADFDTKWESYQDTINSDSFTITQDDRTGEKWRFTFPKHTCLMEDIEVEPELYDNGRIFFRVLFNFIYNPKTWIHYEIDRGRKARIHVDQYKEDGGKYKQTDLDELYGGKEGYQEFVTAILDAAGADTGQRATVSEPIKLNGYGHRFEVKSPVNNSAKTLFLGFREHDEKPFGQLNL